MANSISDSPRSKRHQIVKAAIRVFLEHGYAATTLKKVADEAHVIRATIYSHFADKDELFKAIIEELTVKPIDEKFQQKLMSSSPTEFVYLMRDFVKQKKNDKDYKGLLRIVIGESERFPELARLYFKTVYSQGMMICQNYFESRHDLKVKNAQALTGIVVGSMMANVIQQELLRGKEIAPMELNDVADTLVELLTAAQVCPSD